MEMSKQIFFVITIADSLLSILAAAKYDSDGYQSKQKLPVILMHKQAMAHDGAFNYAFAGDNGIKQGETISPDGTRAGAYSYVDPEGETISVKYTAGKDGFKILQGDHIPRASLVAPQLSGPPTNQRYNQPLPSFASSDETDDFSFGPTGSFSHHKTNVNPHYKAVYKVYEDSSAEHIPQTVPYSKPAARYDTEHDSKPHSFGTGYSFEFGAGQ